MRKKKIDPERFYNLLEIHNGGFLDGVTPTKDYRMLRRYVEMKMLPAVVYGEGRNKRYFVKGKNLIIFIAKWESGDFHN